MNQLRFLLTSFVLPTILILASESLPAQNPDPAATQPTDQLVTVVYSVADLVLPTPNYAFRGVFLPGLGGTGGRGSVGGTGLYGIGSGGFGGGGFGGGGFGGGFFSVSGETPGDTPPHQGEGEGSISKGTLRFTLDDLVAAITSTVKPDSWDRAGGPGSIATLGGMLVVSHSEDVHRDIFGLLKELRDKGGTARSITIRVDWLLLNTEDFRQLVGAEKDGTEEVRRDVLAQLDKNKRAHGEISCLDGQTVHLISGHIRSSVMSVIPVVGQTEPRRMSDAVARQDREQAHEQGAAWTAGKSPAPVYDYLAQVAAASEPATGAPQEAYPAADVVVRDRNVGYQPVLQSINFGALVQVTPMLVPGTVGLVLDLQSIVTRADSRPGVPVDFDVVPLERVNVVAQQFMTTLKAPLGRPVLVAGSTLEPMSAGMEDAQLYLVIEAVLR